jgi:hypothetical protein
MAQPEILPGYFKVETGPIFLGDLLWATLTKKYVEVDEFARDFLSFAGVKDADECVFVLRKLDATAP